MSTKIPSKAKKKATFQLKSSYDAPFSLTNKAKLMRRLSHVRLTIVKNKLFVYL